MKAIDNCSPSAPAFLSWRSQIIFPNRTVKVNHKSLHDRHQDFLDPSPYFRWGSFFGTGKPHAAAQSIAGAMSVEMTFSATEKSMFQDELPASRKTSRPTRYVDKGGRLSYL